MAALCLLMKICFLISTLTIFWVLFFDIAISEAVNNELPDCNSATLDKINTYETYRNLIVVSTLDGKVSALDSDSGGQMVWTQTTGPGPLLSSSISRLELSSQGKWIRLIPSLDGSLYKFNGKTVEPVPVTAETLLKSSYKLADDILITGGKEIRSYGIDLRTGKMRYICTLSGCKTLGEEVSVNEDILLVHRHTQTVRAVEPRTGEERWNFSVGEHCISLVEGLNEGCNLQKEAEVADVLVQCESEDSYSNSWSKESITIKVVVPDGMIFAANDEEKVVWSHKFESPIVNAWQLKEGAFQHVDLFDQKRIIGYESQPGLSPVLYIGIHEKQPYIQHSSGMKDMLFGVTKTHHTDHLPKVEWKPYLATAPSRTPVITTGVKGSEMVGKPEYEKSTALVLRNDYFEYPFDNGYYLYGTQELQTLIENTSHCEIKDNVQKEGESLEQIIIVSLWYWRKDRKRFFIKKKMTILNPVKSTESLQFLTSASHEESCETAKTSLNIEMDNCKDQFVSRYLTDFEPIQCLGRGGYGLVFEAKNKIDDCHYAVKRICLPNKKEAREKVMREVKALAKLDHPGIVRYFNAWMECPPPGWQEQHKFQYDHSERFTPTSFNSVDSDLQPKKNETKDVNPLKPFTISAENKTIGFSFSNHIEEGTESINLQNSLQKHVEISTTQGSIDIVFDEHAFDCGGALYKECSISSVEDKQDSLPFQNYQDLSTLDSSIKCENTSQNNSHKSIEEEQTESGISSISNKKQINRNLKNRSYDKQSRPSKLEVKSRGENSIEPEPRKLFLYIQMQLCQKESLKDWMKANNERNHENILDIFDQIVSAVQYVHERGLMHRDLKPSNIFFSMDGTVKIGDFGLVTGMAENDLHTPAGNNNSFNQKHTDQVGTHLYMSPEQMTGQNYNFKVDIFSLGLIFFELLVTFPTQMERVKILLKVKQQDFPETFNTEYHEECLFVKKLLSPNPDNRPSAGEIKQHKLFKHLQPVLEDVTSVRRHRTFSQRLSSSSSD
ncbi:eukaryotic translation initiation factor 2-alpha kinase-like [Limulus polyphemus]|uniref:PRKR-like endoplasmic reticulum kinase n=1 Tax=Limulus polyphemus TaxID=6850 RepID=A0ABM1C5D4_LIMPO|nr:eukaryotic translation initiation factor 2-alpha kinase-like [Limulus polyphemus]